MAVLSTTNERPESSEPSSVEDSSSAVATAATAAKGQDNGKPKMPRAKNTEQAESTDAAALSRKREVSTLAVQLIKMAPAGSPSLARNAHYHKLCGDVLSDLSGFEDQAQYEYENAHHIFKAIYGEESEVAQDTKKAMVTVKRALTEAAVKRARALKDSGGAAAKEKATREEALAIEAARRLQLQQDQQGKPKPKRSYNYKELFKNHSRIRR
jgi:hypothetical protein